MAAVAGQTHDVVLAGDGYMLVQGAKGTVTYKKKLAGPAPVGLIPATNVSFEVLTGSLDSPVQSFKRAIWSTWSGLGQGMVAGTTGWQEAQAKGKVNDLLSLRPVQDSGALALCPMGVEAQVDTAAPGATQYHYLTSGTITLVSIGDRLYKTADPGTNNSGFTFLAAAAAPVYGLGIWNGVVYVATSANLYTLNLTTGVLTLAANNRAAELVATYQGMMVVSSGATLVWWIAGVGAWSPVLNLDSAVTSLEEFDGALYIGTHTGLYKLEGQLKAKSPGTAPTVLDWFDYKINLLWRVVPYYPTGNLLEFNFCKMVGWRGSLWAFVGGQLYKIRPGSSAANLQIEAQPVYGSGRGLAVCGRWLVACGLPAAGGTGCTLWVNESGGDNGLGWWKLAGGENYIYPFPNGGYAQGVINALKYTAALTTTSFVRWLFDQGNPVGFRADNFGVARTPVTGKVTLPLITPEDLAALAGATGGKVLAVNLLRVGLEWSLIDGGVWWPPLPVDVATLVAMQIVIEVSLNAGLSWETLVEPLTGSLSLNAFWFNGNRIELPVNSKFYSASQMYPSAAPSASTVLFPVPDMGWLVRVTWGGLVMPLLRRVWLDYTVAEVHPQTGQTWELDIDLVDPLVGLDGAVDTGSSNALSKAGRLSSYVSNGNSITFQDLDGRAYRVKVIGFEQRRVAPGALPGLNPGWQGTLKLAEVWPEN
jgi:hypothetical protein